MIRKNVAKYLWMLFLLCFLPFVFPHSLQAAEETVSTEPPDWTSLLEELDTESMDAFQQRAKEELGIQTDTLTAQEWLWEFVRGNWDVDGESLFHQLGDCFFRVLKQNTQLLGKLLLLSVISALLVHLQTSLHAGIARFAGIACHMSIAFVAILSFREAWDLGEDAIDQMTNFMNAMLPPMMVLTSSLGNFTSSALLFPVLMTTTTAVANGVRVIVLPLALFSIVLNIMNQLTEGIRVEKMAKFFTQIAQLGLGFMVTAFVGFITVRTLYASVLDKVVLRTGKFVTDNTIPVVGKMLSDTIEVAAGYIMVLKNALGIYGVIVLLGILTMPLLQMIVMAILYRLTAALVEPLGDARTASLLDKIGGSLWLLTAAIASVSLVFLMMIALIVGLTNNFTL